jgi:DNA invertase Pin-like site-specific DNA recombinase
MSTSELVTAQHLTHEAIVYIRQSTTNQMLNNQESLELQYALKQRALDLGWKVDNISIIDVDLGLTGASAKKREGFKELVTKVTLGEVGIILSYDVTRLSRNCSDWYPLLDICGYKQCLIADRDGVYDPGTINGRLLLGLKGQIAELELSTIKARLNAGLLNKARRGDLALSLPVGLVRNKSNVVYKDPNLEIQNCIDLIFSTFLEKKTAAKVLRYFNDNNLTIPRYDRFGELHWKVTTIAAITFILKNPAYAGAFVYGRSHTARQNVMAPERKTKKVPVQEWKILVKDKYPAYISWETFEKIQETLKDNHAEYHRNMTRGIPRSGAALLHGIIYCGECGHKMVVQYTKGNQYVCNYLRQQRLTPICQHVPADPIDNYVILNFFEALKPIELDAYTQTIASQAESEKKINKSHVQQLERLKYQAKLAERQFNLVDPDNRLVSAEVEKRWEQALSELKLVETELARKQREKIIPQLSQELENAFLEIGKKLPDIWDQSILSRQQKKAFIRCLIEKVIVHRVKPDTLKVRIVWKGGETTTTDIPVTVGSLAMLSSIEDFEKSIIQLSKTGKTDLEIAQCLTEQGYRSPMRKEVLESTVRIMRLKNGIFRKKSQSHPVKVTGYLSVSQVARMLRIPIHWIYDRIHNGQIKVDMCNDSVKGKYFFADTQETIRMLKDFKRGKK